MNSPERHAGLRPRIYRRPIRRPRPATRRLSWRAPRMCGPRRRRVSRLACTQKQSHSLVSFVWRPTAMCSWRESSAGRLRIFRGMTADGRAAQLGYFRRRPQPALWNRVLSERFESAMDLRGQHGQCSSPSLPQRRSRGSRARRASDRFAARRRTLDPRSTFLQGRKDSVRGGRLSVECRRSGYHAAGTASRKHPGDGPRWLPLACLCIRHPQSIRACRRAANRRIVVHGE